MIKWSWKEKQFCGHCLLPRLIKPRMLIIGLQVLFVSHDLRYWASQRLPVQHTLCHSKLHRQRLIDCSSICIASGPVWLQCEECLKWRSIPSDHYDGIPEIWHCSQNPSRRYRCVSGLGALTLSVPHCSHTKQRL